MSGVIITSAKYVNALAAVRCLGKHGIRVACGDDKALPSATFPKAFYSKYCNARFIYPNPNTNPSEFIEAIADFTNKNREYDILMPIDSETLVVSQFKDELISMAPHLKIPIHDYAYISVANNKEQVMELANQLGVPTPGSYTSVKPKNVAEIANSVSYPVVIKLPKAKGAKGIKYVNTKADLVRQYRYIVSKYALNDQNLPIIQEYIDGPSFGVSCLFNHGNLRAKFAHKRLRELPITGGVSVARISCQHQEMEEYAVKLLKALNWHGVAMVEFKLDTKDRKPKLLEINPRFWGSLYLAIASGVEFPYLLYKLATEGDVKPVTEYRLGVQARYLSADIRATAEYILKSRERFTILSDFLDFRNITFDDVVLSDLKPTILQIINPLISLVRTGNVTERS